MKNIFEIIELILTDDMDYGTQAISLVNEGAIERDFMHFNKEHIVKLEIHDEDKRMVMGPILVPNKMILRAYEEAGKDTQYYYIHFSEETVRKTAQRFLENGFQGEATYQHAKTVDDITFVETWVKDFADQDKSTGYGYGDMPIGTWFGIAKIDNDEVWEDIKAGKINAFSIEGHYADAMLHQSKLSTVDEVIEELVDSEEDLKLLQEIIKLLESVDENETDEE